MVLFYIYTWLTPKTCYIAVFSIFLCTGTNVCPSSQHTRTWRALNVLMKRYKPVATREFVFISHMHTIKKSPPPKKKGGGIF